MEQSVSPKLPQLLLQWYAVNRRQLPWREDREPYHVWLSEIMLQQTRVEAARDYYLRFLDALPDLEALAQCPEGQLLKLWEGLGYYNRARNLQKCAKVLLKDYGGRFPTTAPELEKLPGIGPYTAGAIASIAFERPSPAIDGNVLRVMTRLLGDETPIDAPALKERIREVLTPLYPPGSCGDFTQALMELGATVCLPEGQAKCSECPCAALCLARQTGRVERLPVRPAKKARRQEKMTVFLLRCGDAVALHRREDAGLLAGLWEFPHVPGFLDGAAAVQWAESQGIAVADVKKTTEKKHIFTHIEWKMRGVLLEVREPAGPFVWMELHQVDREAALPTAFRQFREEFDWI